MTSRTRSFPLVALIGLALCGCSPAVGADAPAASAPATNAGGSVEMAVSETCTDMADPQCVSVNGQDVLLPPAFEKAGVVAAAVADVAGQNGVDVTFDEAGATVLQALTKEAAEAGADARLLIRIGGELQSAVVVLEALEGAEAQIVLARDDDAQDLVDQLLAG
jgi:hypothetical protein